MIGFADERVINFLNNEVLIYEDKGVIYYLGTEDPENYTNIINEWLQLPVVTLIYNGPEEYRTDVDQALAHSGVIQGIGDIIMLVKLRVSGDLTYISISCNGETYENSESLCTTDQITREIQTFLERVFGEIEKPNFGFLVHIGESIKTEVIEKPNKPVTFEFEQKYFTVKIGNSVRYLPEGFYTFTGNTIYVSKNMNMELTPFYFDNADMVYCYDDQFVVYKQGALRYPDGKISCISQEPYDLVQEEAVPYTVSVSDGRLDRKASVCGIYDGYMIFSNGMISPFSFAWQMKVSGPILEWCAQNDYLFILDLSSYVRLIDLKNRKLLWKKFIPRAWGIGVFEDKVYVGTDNGLVMINFEGETIGERECRDFGVTPNGVIYLTDDEEGHFIRYNDVCVLIRSDEVTVYTDQVHVFHNVQKVRNLSRCVVVKTDKGCWVIPK